MAVFNERQKIELDLENGNPAFRRSCFSQRHCFPLPTNPQGCGGRLSVDARLLLLYCNNCFYPNAIHVERINLPALHVNDRFSRRLINSMDRRRKQVPRPLTMATLTGTGYVFGASVVGQKPQRALRVPVRIVMNVAVENVEN
uniref:Uncharacterized protein n=1 Tax=Strigamia maritima TaxID=126957 RepID=T1IRU2_STRMM